MGNLSLGEMKSVTVGGTSTFIERVLLRNEKGLKGGLDGVCINSAKVLEGTRKALGGNWRSWLGKKSTAVLLHKKCGSDLKGRKGKRPTFYGEKLTVLPFYKCVFQCERVKCPLPG